jgi:hypothetical protein
MRCEDGLCPLLFLRQDTEHGQATREQPLSRDGTPELSQQESVRFRLDVVGDEARTPLGHDVIGRGYRTPVVGVVSVQEGEDGA